MDAPWYRKPLLAWDTESTGVDVGSDRIVTAALVWIEPGKATVSKHHLIDPGVEIPEAATAIHGITSERARAEGRQPEPVLEEIAVDLVDAVQAGWPLVGMNTVFDHTLLDRELRRHGLRTLEDRLGEPIAPCVDALVLDRYVVPRRRGDRKLTTLCQAWGVRIDGAHDAQFDALAAARVAWKIAHHTPEIGSMSLPDLHALQIRERARQCDELRAYFDRTGKTHDGVPGEWPLLPYHPVASTS
ncbi:exonuclease domain-containing protein [Streptosporangium saharense]|uniref:exonuclease domain-containing protein n=1 Tax=Streptosporangium saharense TaxID=1706840 RepID=UPI003330A4E0